MVEKEKHWRNRELREHVAIIDGHVKPTLILKNGTYLNMYTKQWLEANIWIFNDRIVYVGDQLPEDLASVEVVDCTGQFLVPGYIEPHAHPFQMYNPEILANHAATYGTTTLINDNMLWLFLLTKKKAFSLIDEMKHLPISMYWWARYDSQTALREEETHFNTSDILSWLSHESVVQGGELTAWPRLLAGDDRLLYWIQETKRLGKPVEGHLPGASEKTLTKMKLLGVSADHESMTGADVMKRLQLGYQVGLRYSSIRPDLPTIIPEMLAEGIKNFDQLTLTTDGSTPGFYENGLINVCIQIAIEKGIPLEEAYRMGTYNVAKHFGLTDQLGSIVPGNFAHINILSAKDKPTPVSVLAKGEWIVKDHENQAFVPMIDWDKYEFEPLSLDWDLTREDLQFSLPVGVELVSDVIMKPYVVGMDNTVDRLPKEADSVFLLLIDRDGKWRVNTSMKGFTNQLGGLASSYSTTGDIVVLGKDKQDMMLAWQRMKEIGGGIVLAQEGKIIFELPLELAGMMYQGTMVDLIAKEKELKEILFEYGYPYSDPMFTIFFLSSTHLPYVRITQKGIYDVMKNEVLFQANFR